MRERLRANLYTGKDASYRRIGKRSFIRILGLGPKHTPGALAWLKWVNPLIQI
jgi:hypothetical protein